jgi:hypothetical protein
MQSTAFELCTGFSPRFRISPNTARIVFRTRNYRVAFVVELARKYLVLVALKYLQHLARLHVPQSCSLVETGRQNLSALGVENGL